MPSQFPDALFDLLSFFAAGGVIVFEQGVNLFGGQSDGANDFWDGRQLDDDRFKRLWDSDFSRNGDAFGNVLLSFVLVFREARVGFGDDAAAFEDHFRFGDLDGIGEEAGFGRVFVVMHDENTSRVFLVVIEGNTKVLEWEGGFVVH